MKAYLGLYQAGKSMKEAVLEKHYHFKWSVPAWQNGPVQPNLTYKHHEMNHSQHA